MNEVKSMTRQTKMNEWSKLKNEFTSTRSSKANAKVPHVVSLESRSQQTPARRPQLNAVPGLTSFCPEGNEYNFRTDSKNDQNDTVVPLHSGSILGLK